MEVTKIINIYIYTREKTKINLLINLWSIWCWLYFLISQNKERNTYLFLLGWSKSAKNSVVTARFVFLPEVTPLLKCECGHEKLASL